MHDINRYYGDNKPSWNPVTLEEIPTDMHVEKIQVTVGTTSWPVYIANNVFSEQFCNDLIKQFDQQEAYPVGIDGYCNASENIGSYRAMAWTSELAYIISEKLRNAMSNSLVVSGLNLPYPWPNSMRLPFCHHVNQYIMIGSTPFLRFMKYKSGGMHVPHHDAPYENKNEKYITMFSYVLYLNTPRGKGGEFQFINDTRNINNQHFPDQWDISDWTEMSNDVIMSINPERGKLLIFPHWLCHQVQKYVGEGYRYIIRGDVAYGY